MLEDMDEWDFYEQHLEELSESEVNSARYNLIQGRVYDIMRRDVRYDASEAVDLARALNRGEVEDAEEILREGDES